MKKLKNLYELLEKLWKRQIVTLLALAILSSSLRADEGCQRQLETRDVLIQKQDESISLLLKQRSEALKEVDTTGKLPFYVWILVGAASALTLDKIRR